MMTAPTENQCERCSTPVPPVTSDAFDGWEAYGDGQGVICPDCISPADQQTLDGQPIKDDGLI